MSARDDSLAFVCASHSPLMNVGDQDRHRVFWSALAQARQHVDALAPELAVFFVSDHFNVLERIRPQFTIMLEGQVLAEERFGLGPSDLNVSRHANGLAKHLIGAGFDVASARQIEIDHGFSLTARQLFADISQVPVIPIIINTISFPLPQIQRVFDLGQAVRTYLDDLDDTTVLVVGSGGLSHNPPLAYDPAPDSEFVSLEERRARMETAADWIDPTWDEEFLEKFASADLDWLRHVSQEHIDRAGAGANEVRNWIATAATVQRSAKFSDYEAIPEWITGMGVAYG